MSKIKKSVKRLGKNVKKVVKKVAKPLAIAAAVYFTGGAALGAMGSSWGALGSSLVGGAKAIGGSMLKSAVSGGAGGRPGGGMTPYGGDGGGGFNWGGLGMAAVDAYGSYKTGKAQQEGMERSFQTANPFAKYREGFGQQLAGLTPESMMESPLYKASLKSGMQAMGATSAAKGQRLSGKALIDANRFGGGLLNEMFRSESDRLAGLSGATMGFGGGQYGAGAGAAYQGGIQEGLGTVGHALGYGSAPPESDLRYR